MYNNSYYYVAEVLLFPHWVRRLFAALGEEEPGPNLALVNGRGVLLRGHSVVPERGQRLCLIPLRFQ